MEKVKSPLFRDPIYDGAADPVLVYNNEERAWYMIYTNRRVMAPTDGVEWVHGTDLGVAVSTDNGHSFVYRGTLNMQDINKGRNTFWAPEILYVDGVYHMYVSYVLGMPSDWNKQRHIMHYTSTNLWDFKYESTLNLSSDRCIDACVIKRPDGKWGLWYKDEKNGSHTYMVESEDLYNFSNPVEVISDCAHEGPKVFRFKEKYFMITDTWSGQGVYVSDDCINFKRLPDILNKSGNQKDDKGCGFHADVIVRGDRAYILYFTHPGRGIEGASVYEERRSSIQLRELKYDGNIITCDRDEIFSYDL